MNDLTGKVRKSSVHFFAYSGGSDIYQGLWRREDGSERVVAIKVIRGAWDKPDYLARLKRKLVREGCVWTQLHHPNVVPFYGISYDADRPDSPCLVSPYYRYGNISKYLLSHPAVNRLQLIAQVVAGLSYLHKVKTVHGDIKASNILVSDQGEALLTDFGVSRILEQSGFTTKTPGGTCRWMAPELIVSGEQDEEGAPRVTAASDVWAFGMTVVEIFTDRLPFFNMRDTAVLLSVMQGRLPSRQSCPEVSPEVWTGLDRCWNAAPVGRPSMRSLSFFFNVLCALQLERKTISPSEAMQLIDLASSEGVDIPTLAKSDPQSGSSSRIPSPNWRHCTSPSVNVQKRRLSHSMSMSGRPSKLIDAPYECHWPACHAQFSVLGECQGHEMRHVLLESRQS